MRRDRNLGDWKFDPQLFAGSGAGLNYNARVLLRAAASATGSYDTATKGPLMWESAFFSKWAFQIVPQAGTASISGWSVEVDGTVDFRAFLMNQSPPPPEIPPGFTFPTTSWAKLESPSGNAGGNWPNPLTDLGQMLFVPVPIVAVRIRATCNNASGGSIAVVAVAIP